MDFSLSQTLQQTLLAAQKKVVLSFVEKYVVNLRPTQMLSGFDQGD
jgi:hypothetical protein